MCRERWEGGGVSLLVPRARKKGGGGGSNRGRSTRRARFEGFEATRPRGSTQPHTRPSLSLARFTQLVDEAHTNEQTQNKQHTTYLHAGHGDWPAGGLGGDPAGLGRLGNEGLPGGHDHGVHGVEACLSFFGTGATADRF